MMSSSVGHSVPRRGHGSAWSAGQRTPTAYKTPYSVYRRRIRKSLADSTDSKRRKTVEYKQLESTCKDLLGKTWTCYSCSPLFQFRVDKDSLTRYSRNLTGFLASEIKKNTSVYISEGATDISASLAVVKGLAMRKGEPNAIKIVLKNADPKIHDEMYLCSVDLSRESYGFFTSAEEYMVADDKASHEEFLILPLLLCHGLVRPRNAVISWLEENFDCHTKLLKFNPIDLNWMMTMWTSIPFQRKGGETKQFMTEFMWKIPREDLGLDKINYQIQMESLKAIWDCIGREDEHEITLENVEQFMSAIYEHLFYIFHIKFQALSLLEVSSPFVKVAKEGKIKICSSNYVLTVLAHLSCLAVEKLSWKIG